MKLRELLDELSAHAEGWPENLNRPILIKVGREIRYVEATYIDTGFVLVAGRPFSRS